MYDNNEQVKIKKAKKKPEPLDIFTVKNISGFPFMIFGCRVMPGDFYNVTKEDAKHEKSFKRLENAIKLGCLEKV